MLIKSIVSSVVFHVVTLLNIAVIIPEESDLVLIPRQRWGEK
jgi:hypothetical protein